MIALKILLAASFLTVFVQDCKDRYVYWFLFPIIGYLCGILYFKSTLPELFIASIILNGAFISILIFGISLYARFKLKTALLETIGLGDLLLFVALALSFSTISFVAIFIGALIFSLALHLLATIHNGQRAHVPLAGYMSLFFLASYVLHWSGLVNVVYTL